MAEIKNEVIKKTSYLSEDFSLIYDFHNEVWSFIHYDYDGSQDLIELNNHEVNKLKNFFEQVEVMDESN